jgi:hypothetical protein
MSPFELPQPSPLIKHLRLTECSKLAELEAAASSRSEMANLSARDSWLATQNHDGSPHLVPIWFVAKRADSIWIATGRHSTKVTNI